jgi:tyrosine-protein kinase Etk/Wzc
MAESEIDYAGTMESGATAVPILDEDESSIDLVALLQALRRGKRTVLRIALTTFVLATVIAFLLTPRYTSTISFIPPALNSGNSSMAAALAGQLSAVGGLDMLGAGKTSGDLYAGILESRSIASELVKRFDMMRVYKVKRESQAEKALVDNTTVIVDVKSTIVTLSVTDESPERARDLANAYMDALRRTNGRLALDQSSQRALFFQQQLAKEKDDLEDAEVNLKETEEQSGLIAPTGQTEAEIDTIAQTQAQIAVREVQLAALRESATDQNPDVIRLRSEIDDLQGQLSRLQRGSGSKSTATIPTSKVPEIQLEYVRKEREVKYHEALFDALAKQYEAARLDEARDAPVLQVLDPASYPDMRSSPKRLYYILSGLFLGFLAGCLWVLVHEPLRVFRASFDLEKTA